MNPFDRIAPLLFAAVLLETVLYGGFERGLLGQSPQCDPTKVMTTETCLRCHGNEVTQWKKTPHFETFENLAKNPRASEITDKLGLTSVKRNDICTQCHYTMQAEGDRIKPIAGVSCESCHGASKDWVNIHNDYGGPLATRDSESAAHRLERLDKSVGLGMRNTTNVYLIARNCLQCHTVPNEKLVNIGGHVAGSDSFELVAWSQGVVRHNFARTGATSNTESTPERLRVMYIAGLLADLEFSTRAVATATTKGTYGSTVAERAGRVSLRLFEIQQEIHDEHLERALIAFASAQLRTDNGQQLLAIADEIQQAGLAFAKNADGTELAAVDAWLPNPRNYK